MDPIAGVAVLGVGYLLVKREGASTPTDSQPESIGGKNASKKPLPAKQLSGAALGAAVGALTGKAIADMYLDVTAGYNAPTTKAIAVPVIVGTAALGGAIIVFVGITYGALAAGYAGVIVIAVLAIVFISFVIAANVEDVDRWNAYVFHKQMIVKSVAAGAFAAALAMANEGAKKGIPGLGFYLQANKSTVYHADTLYFKTAFDASPKIPAPGGHGGILGRGGLDKDYYFPVVIPYKYETYFGTDGSHVLTRNDGTKVNLITFLNALRDAQQSAYDGLKKQLGKVPTFEQWVANADTITDADGRTLREWIALHDAFGKHVQPAVPWLDTYLLQSIEFPFEKDGKVSVYQNHKRETRAGLANTAASVSGGFGGYNNF